jgi:hypothetical protein
VRWASPGPVPRIQHILAFKVAEGPEGLSTQELNRFRVVSEVSLRGETHNSPDN